MIKPYTLSGGTQTTAIFNKMYFLYNSGSKMALF